jgi:anti-sigma-K factor RskA
MGSDPAAGSCRNALLIDCLALHPFRGESAAPAIKQAANRANKEAGAISLTKARLSRSDAPASTRGWRIAAFVPLALMVVVFAYITYAFARQSNLRPILLVFAAPIGMVTCLPSWPSAASRTLGPARRVRIADLSSASLSLRIQS